MPSGCSSVPAWTSSVQCRSPEATWRHLLTSSHWGRRSARVGTCQPGPSPRECRPVRSWPAPARGNPWTASSALSLRARVASGRADRREVRRSRTERGRVDIGEHMRRGRQQGAVLQRFQAEDRPARARPGNGVRRLPRAERLPPSTPERDLHGLLLLVSGGAPGPPHGFGRGAENSSRPIPIHDRWAARAAWGTTQIGAAPSSVGYGPDSTGHRAPGTTCTSNISSTPVTNSR